MIVQKQKPYAKRPKRLNLYQELCKYLYENDSQSLFKYISNNFSKWILDKKTFCFIFRQIKPHLNDFFDSSSGVKKDLNKGLKKIY